MVRHSSPRAKEFYRLLLKGHVVGYAKKNGKGLLFSDDGEVWSDSEIEYDDAVKLDRLPGYETGGVVASCEDITKTYKVIFE